MSELKFPSVSTPVNDNSNTQRPRTDLKRICTQGKTEIGVIDKLVYVPNWNVYLENFGGYVEGQDFPIYIKRALDNGAKLYIASVGHYTDPTDKATLEGTKASATITQATDSVVFNAKSVGAGYNSVKVLVTDAKTGEAGKVDITITFQPNGVAKTLSQTIANFPNTPTTTDIAVFNVDSKWVDLGTVTGLIPTGSASLSGGVKNFADIVDADYVGNAEQETGLYAFDNVPDAMHFFNLYKPSPSYDAALANYCLQRKDMCFHLRTPVGADIDTMVDYREGTGIYSHTPLNTWLGALWCGDIQIEDPKQSKLSKNISALADIAGKYVQKDNSDSFGEWFSIAIAEFKTLVNNLGIPYNVGKSSLEDKRTLAYHKGLNFVMFDKNAGNVIEGNRTLYKEDSLLKYTHIAHLTMYLSRELNAIAKAKKSRPNDPEMWGNLYRSAVPFIEEMVNRRAIEPTEGTGWLWLGDQEVATINDLNKDNINSKDDVQQGYYRAIFKYKPKGTAEFIEIEINPHNSSTDFTI